MRDVQFVLYVEVELVNAGHPAIKKSSFLAFEIFYDNVDATLSSWQKDGHGTELVAIGWSPLHGITCAYRTEGLEQADNFDPNWLQLGEHIKPAIMAGMVKALNYLCLDNDNPPSKGTVDYLRPRYKEGA